MERDGVRLPPGLDAADDRFLADLAGRLHARRLTAPAVVALECLRPAAFLGGQAMRLLSPFVALVTSGQDWDRLAQLLEIRGTVERLLSHLEALPEARAQREEPSTPPDAAHVIVDCGSTTTKAVLVACREGHWRLAGRAEAPTTVEAPQADVMVGVRAALTDLQQQTGHRLLQQDGQTLAPASGPDQGVGALLATSSAGGGLQMVVVGLVRAMTAASAERAALGAGAIVGDVLAWDDAEDDVARLGRLRQQRPDMVLLAGGTDGGAERQVVALAEQLAAAQLQPRWEDGKLPVVYAGNAAAAEAVVAALGETAEVVVTENLRPDLERENLRPVRQALHEVFLRHVMARAPGYSQLQGLCAAPVLPTPAAFGRALEAVAAAQEGDVVAVDLGGATCDVFSVHDGAVYRSVSANLGLSFSLGAVCDRAGWTAIARWLPVPLDDDELRDRVRNKMLRPTTLPQTATDLLLEQAAAREALRLALDDHARALLPLRGTRAGPTGVEALAATAEAPPDGVVWPRVRLLLGSGGPLAHAPDRRQAAAILVDGCRPQGLTALAVDSVFVLPHLGALREVAPEAAGAVLQSDAVVPLGACLAPVTGEFPPDGRDLATVSLTSPDGGAARTATLRAGAVTHVPLSEGPPWQLRAEPAAGVDLGSGRGRPLTAPVAPGPAGLILDGRGPLGWPAGRLACREQARAWLAAVGALPPESTT
jgi:uncharacterized protein (TIGR01319 family)